MIKNLIPFSLLILLFYNQANAQQIYITGKVSDKESHLSINNCLLTLSNNEGDIVYQMSSDSTGNFRLPIKYLAQCDQIKFHAINYQDLFFNKKSIKRILYGDMDLSNLFLEPKKISLQEITVKPSNRYSDTTKIDLSQKNFDQSVTIDDLLMGQYGFTRNSNGQLFYKGQPVSNLVVNGKDFFGKNNLDIYKLLPALIINTIEVVKTNIDTLTNTVISNPHISVNLKLKDKYKSGKFGNVNIGVGTETRYLANTNLFTYKNKEQISLSINSNNVNIEGDGLFEPKVDFTANGNNLTSTKGRLMYSNEFSDKVELNFSIAGKLDGKKANLEINRQEENINKLSKTSSSTDYQSRGIQYQTFNIAYKIDPYSTIKNTEQLQYNDITNNDSSKYIIDYNNLHSISTLNRTTKSHNTAIEDKLSYEKRFKDKKGRFLNFESSLKKHWYTTNEVDNVFSNINQQTENYFIDGLRAVRQFAYKAEASFTEPWNDSSYGNGYISYEKANLEITSKATSDTLLFKANNLLNISNQFLVAGLKFHKASKKLEFDGDFNETYNIKDIALLHYRRSFIFFNFDARFRYKINANKSFVVKYTERTNYPTIYQLTNLGSSFDLVSQLSGNPVLIPERKQDFILNYNFKPSDLSSVDITANYNYYKNKFGYSINNDSNTTLQSVMNYNIGSTNAGQFTVSFLQNLTNNQYLNYTSDFSFEQLPTLVNQIKFANTGLKFNQSFASSFIILKSYLTIAPVLTFSYYQYNYTRNITSLKSLTYSDKLSLTLGGYQLCLYPFFNYNLNMSNNLIFSMNGEIKKNFDKNNLSVWVNAYDIFNSFNYYNNYLGPSYNQTVRYSNLYRYILFGISYKFNNMK